MLTKWGCTLVFKLGILSNSYMIGNTINTCAILAILLIPKLTNSIVSRCRFSIVSPDAMGTPSVSVKELRPARRSKRASLSGQSKWMNVFLAGTPLFMTLGFWRKNSKRKIRKHIPLYTTGILEEMQIAGNTTSTTCLMFWMSLPTGLTGTCTSCHGLGETGSIA